MKSHLMQKLAVEYAFTFNQGYYFSTWYFACDQLNSSISVNRGRKGSDEY